MRSCQRHWDMLRQEVIDQGLGDWIASSGEIASEQLVDQLTRGEVTKVNYDPLTSCWFMLMDRTLSITGIAGMAPDFGCPVCRLNEHRKPDGSCPCDNPECPGRTPGAIPDFETWLVGPDSCVAAAKEHMRIQGWLPEPNLCPECAAGKCQNCDGTAYDNTADARTSCECPNPVHR